MRTNGFVQNGKETAKITPSRPGHARRRSCSAGHGRSRRSLWPGARDHDGNIQPGVAGEEGAGEGGLQQNVVLAALAAGQHLAADVLGDGVHLPAAGLLFALMDLVGEVVGGGAAAAGVGEDVDFQEADLLQERAALPEIFLRLAREAADAVGG